MSDWELKVDNNVSPQNESEWELSSFPEHESFKDSLFKAPGKIASDVGSAVMSGINAIPGYYEQAKTEIPGAAQVLMHHPMDALKQLGAGVTELGHGIINMRPNFYNYMANRLNLIPEQAANAIAPAQPDIEPQINALFGEPTEPGEKLIRGLGRNAANALGGIELGSALKFPINTKGAIKNSILNAHDVLESRANKGFENVSKEVEKRGINNVPLWNQDVDMHEIRSYFPETKQYKELFNKAYEGDYNALRKLQTDLYKKGKQNLGSSLEADRMRGAEMLEKRENINNAISNHLESTGNTDLSNILRAARNDYRTLQNIYYNQNMNPAIVNMVNKDFRKIPKNLLSVIQEESKPMQQLRDFHPGLEININKYNFRKNALSGIKKYALPAGFGALGGYGAYQYGTHPK